MCTLHVLQPRLTHVPALRDHLEDELEKAADEGLRWLDDSFRHVEFNLVLGIPVRPNVLPVDAVLVSSLEFLGPDACHQAMSLYVLPVMTWRIELRDGMFGCLEICQSLSP